MNKFIFAVSVISLLFTSCAREKPTQIDGRQELRVVIADNSGLLPVNPELGYAPLAEAAVTLISGFYYESPEANKKYHAYTDSAGIVFFQNLPLSSFTLSAEKRVKVPNSDGGDSVEVILRGSALFDLAANQGETDTVGTTVAVQSPIVINEIYYVGGINRAYYFYDQFVELYNASDTTQYLDGLIICRGRQYHDPDLDILDYVQVLYVFQFPGEPLTGREYPIEPGEFVTIAGDAVDHSAYVDNALDLSNSPWEFFTPYASDIDNPAQNVVNVIKERPGDFLINLVHNFVILADGTGYYRGEVNDSGVPYIHIPIETILDGVEYSTNSDKLKELTTRVDAGFAGVGIPKYSGISIERRTPGFDTNNSRLDFVNIKPPTPGWQHEE